jgi:hypothetical protein
MDFYSVLQAIIEAFGVAELVPLVSVVVVYWLAFRKRLGSIFDPLTYVVAFSAITVILLFVLQTNDVVSQDKLIFSLSTLALYYGTFWMVAERLPRKPRQRVLPPQAGIPTLAVLFSANVLLLGITYAFFGIPLFLESRLTQFAGGGGVGVIARLTGGLQFASLLLAFMALRGSRHHRLWGKALIAQFVLSAILSGSKGAIVTAVFAWYLARVYAEGSWLVSIRWSKSVVLTFGLILALPLFTLVVQSGAQGIDLVAAASGYATRIAAEGDGYVYFFGDDLIDRIARPDLLALARPILAALRLVPVETTVNPGFEVMREIFSVDDPSAGPNARLPIYLLYFYGVGGIVLAPMLGAILGFARNRLLQRAGRSRLRFVVIATIYLNCTRFEVDPQFSMNAFFDLLLVSPILWLAFRAGGLRKVAIPPAAGSRAELARLAP